MPVAQLYAVVGDGNVRRNMTQMNNASRPSMVTAKVIDCQSAALFTSALQQVPLDTTVCIVESVTSFLVAAQDSGSIFGTIDPVLTDFANTLGEFCAARNTLQVVVAPPMFRPKPVWYHSHLPQVAQQFSTILMAKKPRNLHLLSSPVCQDLCPDEIHLTPVSGLHFVLHLFDDAHRIVSSIGAKG